MSNGSVDVTVRQLKAFKVVEGVAPNATLSDGTKYYGEVRPHDGAPHGRGFSTGPDGSRYGGDWRDGKYHGKGAMVAGDYDYEGEWEYGRMHGAGTMLFKDSMVSAVVHGIATITPFEVKHRPHEYRGHFHHAHQRHGHGVMLYRSGDVYDGEWNANQRDGYGTISFVNGEKYVGCWVKDERCGLGTMTYNDGSVFTGNMVNDARSGEGVLKFANGDEYRGNFESDTLQGFGVMTYRNGDTYTGMWKDGLRHGKGDFTLKRSGATISGTFVKGLLHGSNCTATMPGRSFFRGDYVRGERCRGTMWESDMCYHGEWVGDIISGRGLMWYPNGDFYYGQFFGSKRHGKGCITLTDGTEYAGEFAEDRWCGTGVRQDKDGSISAGTFGPQTLGQRMASGGIAMLPATRQRTRAEIDTGEPISVPERPAEAFPLVHGYQGEWDGCALSGIGNVYFPSGDTFFGLFQGGIRHGPGLLRRVPVPSTNLDSQLMPVTAVGEWKNDIFCGPGTVRFNSGNVYQGEWEDGNRHGHGVFAESKGNVYKGEWSEDIQCGEGVLFVANTKEPIYTTMTEGETEKKSPTSLLGSVFGMFSRGQPSAPERILLGYEDLCSVRGVWVRDTNSKNDKGKLCGTVTIFFSDIYEKIYQGHWVGNKQRIEVPHATANKRKKKDRSAAKKNDESNATTAPVACSLCDSSFGFLRKESSCFVCGRISCPRCLRDSQPPFLNKKKSVSTHAGDAAVVGTVPMCAECVSCVSRGMTFATQWYTFRQVTSNGSTLTSNGSLCAQQVDYQVFRGFFVEGNIPHGPGTLWRNAECCYHGDFAEGRRAGHGTVMWANGEEYTGHWRDDKPHGTGVYKCSSGYCLEGEWSAGKLSRLFYQGEMVPGGYERHGLGIAVYDDGTRYNGQWHFNSRHGAGIVQYANGTMYSGSFEHDTQHGVGKIVTTDSIFLGQFERGLKHGEGALVVGNKTLQGSWENDVLRGWVRIWNSDDSEIIDTIYDYDCERTDIFMLPQQQEDSAVSTCPGCKSSFGFFLRRHHCRLCGGIFCDSCSHSRRAMPDYFKLEGPQRVCDRCNGLLDLRISVAIKRYADGGVYVGQWCESQWAGRGLYRCPNGHTVPIRSPMQQHEAHTVAAGSGAAMSEDVHSLEMRRQELAMQPAASTDDLNSFSVWWERMLACVRYPKPYDFVAHDDISKPTTELPIDIPVFTEEARGSAIRLREAASKRRINFAPATLPTFPKLPIDLRPQRPRKIVEPAEDDVLARIRSQRIDRFVAVSESPRTHASPAPVAAFREGDSPSTHPNKDVLEASEVSAGADVPSPNPDRSDAVLSSVSRTRLNHETPPKPPQEEGFLQAWTGWEPCAVPAYKGIASLVGGERLGRAGTINSFVVEGLDSGPLPFADCPQSFSVSWSTRSGTFPVVSQQDALLSPLTTDPGSNTELDVEVQQLEVALGTAAPNSREPIHGDETDGPNGPENPPASDSTRSDSEGSASDASCPAEEEKQDNEEQDDVTASPFIEDVQSKSDIGEKSS